MFKLAKRSWNYATAYLTGRFNEAADPKVQLEQAIGEAQEQHLKLKEQAVAVIAHQKQTEMRLSKALEDLEKSHGLAQQAVRMAEEAQQNGDSAKAAEYTHTAEVVTNRLIAIEGDVENLKALNLQAAESSEKAKNAVKQNAMALQKKLGERQKLLSQLDQAKMQEQVSAAMTSLNEVVGQDVPTLEEVRTKIEARYAKALSSSELASDSVESRMLEVEQAQLKTATDARLAQIRAQIGIGSGSGSGSGTPAVEAAPSESSASADTAGAPEAAGDADQAPDKPADS